MLKHVQLSSPQRQRCDTLSIRSSVSSSSSMCSSHTSSSSRSCSSPEPELQHQQQSTMYPAASYASHPHLAEPQTTVKIFTACLRIDIAYKTLGIAWSTSAKDVVGQLLRRCKIRQRDPRLFYLAMHIRVRGATTCPSATPSHLILDDAASPAILQACYPRGDTEFHLQMRAGGLVRVQTTCLQPASQYKSVLISSETSSDELLALLLGSFRSAEPVERFSVYEMRCEGDGMDQRKLHPDDRPLRSLQRRAQRGETCQFVVMENPLFGHKETTIFRRDEEVGEQIVPVLKIEEDTDNNEILQPTSEDQSDASLDHSAGDLDTKMCPAKFGESSAQVRKAPVYNPVYNIREIRSSQQTALFSASPVQRKSSGDPRTRFAMAVSNV